MNADFDLTGLALAGCCPGNEVLVDDKGLPSIMVKIPKMTFAQLGMGASTATHPAFIVNGQEVDHIYISKYQNVVQEDRAYSLPGVDPKTSITLDKAIEVCENKGEGWHLMSRMEWGLFVRWCQNNGVMPKGNNAYGKHSSESVYKAIPANKDATHYALRTLTGTGPKTWNHNQEADGVADLCGNVSEWMGGIRIVYGELQVLINNNAADSTHSQAANSTEWKAIRASDGEFVTPNGSGTTSGTVKMDCQSGKLVYNTTITGNTGSGSTLYSSCTINDISCDASIGDAAKLILQNLGMLMFTSGESFSSHAIWWDNQSEERSFFSGGRYSTSTTGLASFAGTNGRGSSGGGIGFRSAYVELPD